MENILPIRAGLCNRLSARKKKRKGSALSAFFFQVLHKTGETIKIGAVINSLDNMAKEEFMPRCLKCGSTFPNRMLIDGKVRVLNSRRFCLECSPFGEHNTTDITIEHMPKSSSVCFICKEEKPISEFYYHAQTGNPLSYCKECFNRRAAERTRKIKQKAVEYKGGHCQICGYARSLVALDFHHLNPREKDITIGNVRNRSFERIKDELDKCLLVCSNCHREIHDGIIDLSPFLKGE